MDPMDNLIDLIKKIIENNLNDDGVFNYEEIGDSFKRKHLIVKLYLR